MRGGEGCAVLYGGGEHDVVKISGSLFMSFVFLREPQGYADNSRNTISFARYLIPAAKVMTITLIMTTTLTMTMTASDSNSDMQ